MNYFTECLIRFQSLDTITRETFGSIETYASLKEIEDKYKLKLSFLLILLVIDELEEEDIEDYLVIKFKLSPAVAKNVKKEIVDTVLTPALEKIVTAKPLNNSVISKEDILNVFSKRIVETLKASSEIIDGLNFSIFKLLNEHDELEEKIIEALYNSNEILNTAKLIIEDREVTPSIANWLKDFIKANGSELFDELALAQYLSTSLNTKNLKAEDKNLLRKLLKLYRNLVFFPESMEDVSVEDWQIFPVDKIEQKPKAAKAKVFQDALDDEKISVKKEEIKPLINPLDELQTELTKYNSGTLEHKAVTQEIGRLNKKTKK